MRIISILAGVSIFPKMGSQRFCQRTSVYTRLLRQQAKNGFLGREER